MTRLGFRSSSSLVLIAMLAASCAGKAITSDPGSDGGTGGTTDTGGFGGTAGMGGSGGTAGIGGTGGTAGIGGSGGTAGIGGTGGTAGIGGTGGTAGIGGTGGTAGIGGTGGSANVYDPGIISNNPDTVMEAETHVAAAANGFVAVAWIGIGGEPSSVNGYTFSKDGGTTWGPVASIPSPHGLASSDPVLAVDSKNNFYLTWVGFDDTSANPSQMGIYVSRAAAGTTTFGEPVLVSEANAQGMLDKPWITVTNKDTILVTWVQEANGGYTIDSMVARSEDGVLWERHKMASAPVGRNLYYPCAPAHGDRVWATYVEYSFNTRVRLQHSDDDGKTWSQAVVVSESADISPAFDDPTCVADENTVYVSYGVSTDPVSQESQTFQRLQGIRVVRSDDGGETVAARFQVADPQGKVYLHPQLAREGDGAIDLVYYAGAGDNDPGGSVRLARLAAGDTGFGPSVSIHAPIQYVLARDSELWLGDYTGVIWLGGQLHVAFTDNAGGISHVGYVRVHSP
jgi:hypothetical protein